MPKLKIYKKRFFNFVIFGNLIRESNLSNFLYYNQEGLLEWKIQNLDKNYIIPFYINQPNFYS